MVNACYILFPHQLFDEIYIKQILEREENKSKYIKIKRIKNFLFVSFDFFKNELM